MTFREYAETMGEEKAQDFLNNLLKEMASSSQFKPTHQTSGMVLFKVLD